jgi:hypothetical protein
MQGDTVVVESAFGESFYLAARKGEKYLVGWPAGKDEKLWDLAMDHVKRQRDFYNEKQLLGVLKIDGGRELLTLVNLRRRYATTHFGEVGGEWDADLETVVEPWRLSLWRWKYDQQHQELLLSGRGTFFRKIFLPGEPTPTVEVTPELWAQEKKKDILWVGEEPSVKKKVDTP